MSMSISLYIVPSFEWKVCRYLNLVVDAAPTAKGVESTRQADNIEGLQQIRVNLIHHRHHASGGLAALASYFLFLFFHYL